MSDFVHLHLHTEYSLLDGACRIDRLFDRAKELGQTAIAITDHGVMYGVVDFYKAAKKKGIKPIIGCEMYVAPRTRFDKEFKLDGKRNHLVLLCKNNDGYKNLIKMVSLSFTEGFYTKPRIDKDLLLQYHKDLICLSGCMGGELARNVSANNLEEAAKTAKFYHELFGDDYYIELQNYNLPECAELNYNLVELAKKQGIKVVATNDVHYVKREDNKMHKVLLCIQTSSTVNQPNMEFSSDEFYMKSQEEMLALFAEVPEAIYNTKEIADKCDFSFDFNEIRLPHFNAQNGKTNQQFFLELCEEGFERIYGNGCSSSIRQRLEREILVITQMGYIDYFLIVADFIRYAKSKGIPVGPGRGSGAGSLVAYCLGITQIDPVEYGLIFERFLNPERVSMPDFDIDFCYERRQEVIDYVVRKYGANHVAGIATFGTMAAKSAVRDVARAMGYSYSLADTVAGLIPGELGITLEKALEIVQKLKTLYNTNEEVKELVDMAMQLEGMPRHCSSHAAGIVITKDPTDTLVPLQKLQENITTQFPMGTLEELGLLKIDFLGLKALTVISHTEELIRKKQPDFSIQKISHNEPKVFEMLSNGFAKGVFQFESSSGIRQVLVNLKPESIEDITAIVALFRPGPIDSIPQYIQNKKNKNDVKYKTPLLKPILEVTYGCIIYQEQVMQIFQKLAGYSYGRADIVRRAMAKKKADVMERERHNFIFGLKNLDGSVECVGALASGVPEQVANELFNDMSSFASYAFNKSHAAAYAVISYQTAYLKCFFPHEYFASLFTSVVDNKDKIREYVGECARLKIEILPPDINLSNSSFSVAGDKIRFGLSAIKGVGRSFIDQIVKERVLESFKSFRNFCERLSGHELGKRAVESLIKSGSFDSLGEQRKQLLETFEEVLENINSNKRSMVLGQLTLWEAETQAPLPKTRAPSPEYSALELASLERESLGLYLTTHPLEAYNQFCKDGVTEIEEVILQGGSQTKQVKIMGILLSVERLMTRHDEEMAFATIEDKSGSLELILFPKIFDAARSLLVEGKIIVAMGEIDFKEENSPKIIVSKLFAPVNNEQRARRQEKPARPGLYLRVDCLDSDSYQAAENLLKIFDGQTKVYILFEAESKLKLAPSSMWVDANQTLVDQLKLVLGDENVKLV